MNKKLIILGLSIMFCLSGCDRKPYLKIESVKTMIQDNDPVYDYMNGTINEVEIVKEQDQEEKKVVWVETATEFNNFTYNGSYKIECGLYKINGKKEWDVDDFQIMYDKIRFIPTQYDYTGTWMSEDGEYCFLLNDFEWDEGKVGSYDEFSRNLEGYIDENDSILHFGMKTINGDELCLDFNNRAYEEDDIMQFFPFKVYHFGVECYHISNESQHLSGILYNRFDRREPIEGGQNASCMADSLVLKTSDGDIIANGEELRYEAMKIVGGNNESIGFQLDFQYDIDDLFLDYANQEIDMYSFDTEITTISYTEDDVYPFLTIIYNSQDYDKTEFEKLSCVINATALYFKQTM